MADTVFSKIIRGEIPCHKVYEDAQVLAFLDINPLSHGHTLVVPKEAAETLDRLSDESAAAVGTGAAADCAGRLSPPPAPGNTTFLRTTARARTRRSPTCTSISSPSRLRRKGSASGGRCKPLILRPEAPSPARLRPPYPERRPA